MSTFRIHKSKDYTIVSNLHLREKEMSLKAKGLLTLMLSLPDDWDYSISGLTNLSKDGKDSIMKTLDELVRFRYLVMDKSRDEHGRYNTIYNIYEMPFVENPLTENPIRENRCGKSESVNPLQYNTNNKYTSTNSSPINSPTIDRSNTNNQTLNDKRNLKERDFSFVDPLYLDAFTMWIDYKKQRGEMYKTDMTLRSCYEKLVRFCNGNADNAMLIVRQSIENDWKGLFELKDNNAKHLIENGNGNGKESCLERAIRITAEQYSTNM